MVRSVRAEYDGLLTYDMIYLAVVQRDVYVGSQYLWEDLDLDVVGLSAGFALTDAPPTAVMSVDSLERGFDEVFREYLLRLAADNPGRPIVFTEYYALDTVETPADPSNNGRLGERFVFSDGNGNGVDDGRETQANVFRAFFRTMQRYPGVLKGAFFWDNWITTDELWQAHWARRRSFSIRDKPAEEVVRSAYAQMAANADPVNRPPAARGALPDRTLAPNRTLNVDVSRAFIDPDGDALTFAVSSSAPQVVAARAAGALVTLTAVSEGAATIRVTAADPGGLSATRSFTVSATTVSGSFTDDPIQPGVTPVRAVHFAELRTRIDALRRAGGLQAFPWTDPVLTAGVTPVRLAHLLELREALSAAYAAEGRTAPGWTDASPTARSAPIRAVHLMELRAAVLALE